MALDQKIIDLYDEYTHKPLPRRVFLERLALMVGSAASIQTVLSVLEPNAALAQTIAETDPRIRTGDFAETVNAVPVKGYLAQPAQAGRRPAVLVIHENRGLNAHIKDVTRRLAAEGFLALGLDFLTPLGGTPADADQARDMFGRLDRQVVVAQGRAALLALKRHEGGNGKAGAVGFCWGGGTVNTLAAESPELDAGVVYYGQSPAAEAVARINAPLMMHYASLDTRINAGVPAYEAALKAANKRFTIHMYEGVNHAFNNDTSPERYDARAAAEAWARTLAFFRQELGGGV